MHKLGIKGITQ
ncbi:Protein of unknown function [Lactobacillus helveticus CIRM-BIA 103]|nr:Protein of unknown function [Lactobacillus helveticus CIRM-BIA 103]